MTQRPAWPCSEIAFIALIHATTILTKSRLGLHQRLISKDGEPGSMIALHMLRRKMIASLGSPI